MAQKTSNNRLLADRNKVTSANDDGSDNKRMRAIDKTSVNAMNVRNVMKV